MSAKKAKSSTPARSPAPEPAASAPAPATAAATASTAAPVEHVAWIDSPDPKKRQIGKIVLVAVWIYVGALWLLALDQWFHWGIFGPKIPPVP